MILHHGGFPIRKSAGHWIFAPNRSLSQLVTSFVGSWCQGIHLMLFLAWTSCISLLQHLIAFEFRNWLFEVFFVYTVFAFLAKSVVLHLKRKNLCFLKFFSIIYLFVSDSLYSVFNEHSLHQRWILNKECFAFFAVWPSLIKLSTLR